MIPLLEAIDGDLMGAGFEPCKGFSSFSSTAPSSPSVPMPLLGCRPTRPIQYAERETSRTSPFTWQTPSLAVHLVLHRCPRMPSSAPCAAQHPAVHGPAMLWTPGFRHTQDVCVPACHISCTELCRLTWPLCRHYALVYVLFIHPWYGKWSEPSRKYSPGVKKTLSEITLLLFRTLHWQDFSSGPDPPRASLV